MIPANELYETEGGTIKTKPSSKIHYSQGTILQISPYAAQKLSDLDANINVNDEVMVSKQVLNSDVYHFYLDRTKAVQDFNGIIAIPHTLIEAKIN